MADIFREVDEEVRQDQVQRWLARYWGWLLLAGLVVVAVVGAWRGYDYWRTQQEQAAGGLYLDALKLARDGKSAEALQRLDGLATSGTPGYRQLARLRGAAERGLTDATAGAKQFDAIAADATVDPAFRDIARLRAAMMLLDTLDAPALKARLDPLADANSALRSPARELQALAALKAGDAAGANRALDAIEADPTSPAATRQRAAALQALARDMTKNPAAPAVATPSSTPPAPPPAAPTP